jgi:hypothetical protein
MDTHGDSWGRVAVPRSAHQIRSLSKPASLSSFCLSPPSGSQRARPQPHVLLPGYHAVASLAYAGSLVRFHISPPPFSLYPVFLAAAGVEPRTAHRPAG